MKTIYHVYICDDDVGEVEGMFDTDGKLLGTWSNNDGNWRGEYFDPFMKELGIEVKDGSRNRKLIKALRDTWKAWLNGEEEGGSE